jgi:hypothetical protein
LPFRRNAEFAFYRAKRQLTPDQSGLDSSSITRQINGLEKTPTQRARFNPKRYRRISRKPESTKRETGISQSILFEKVNKFILILITLVLGPFGALPFLAASDSDISLASGKYRILTPFSEAYVRHIAEERSNQLNSIADRIEQNIDNPERLKEIAQGLRRLNHARTQEFEMILDIMQEQLEENDIVYYFHFGTLNDGDQGFLVLRGDEVVFRHVSLSWRSNDSHSKANDPGKFHFNHLDRPRTDSSNQAR